MNAKNIYGKIVRQLAVKKQYLSPTKVRIIYPGGLSYEAFSGLSGYASVRPWSVLKMIEAQAVAAMMGGDNPSFLDAHKYVNKLSTYVLASKTKLNPQLYDVSLRKGPLVSDIELVHIGNKSFNTKTTVSLVEFDSPLLINQVKSIFVNPDTGKVAEPPSSWKQKMSKYLSDHPSSLKLTTFDFANSQPKSSEYSLHVPASDADWHFHLNWTYSAKYCYDAFISYQLKENGGRSDQVVNRDARSISLSYLKGFAVGDKLTVKLWQSSEDENLYHFHLVKDDPETVGTECSIQFYPHVS